MLIECSKVNYLGGGASLGYNRLIVCHFRKGTNAVVFWMDWKLSDFCMTSGLVEKCHIGERPKWSVAHRQGVFFLPHEKAIGENCEGVHCKVVFSPISGDIRFSFWF